MPSAANPSNAEVLPVLIAGAGPTGLTAALELTRFGIPVRLIDKAEAPETTSRAIGIQARTLELLEMRGLVSELIGLGNHGAGGSAYGGGKRVFSLDFSRIPSRYNYLLFLSQAETERILRERLQQEGVRTERGVELIALRQDPHAVTAVLRHNDGDLDECRAAYLIDAEGAHSIVRPTLGIEFEGKTLQQTFLLGDLYLDSELEDTDFHLFSSEHGFAALFPLGDRRFRFIADRPIHNTDEEAPSLDECQTLYDQRSPIPARMRDLQWSSYFHINSRRVARLRVGRIFFGGDAAHIHSPAGAQGMNTGMQDMINLGWKLAWVLQRNAPDALLDTYQDDRLPVIDDVLNRTERLTEMMESENRVVRALFENLAPLIVSTDFAQENATERISQLGVHYRRSALSEEYGLLPGIHAGDRVPDGIVHLLDSSADQPERKRLFELLDPSRCTLLILAGASPDNAASALEERWASRHEGLQVRRITAPENEGSEDFAKAFGSPHRHEPLLYLIRPDGYVGFRAPAGDERHLEAWLQRWLEGPNSLPAAA